MALTLNTNSGFVTASPSADPGGASTTQVSTRAFAQKDTMPAGKVKVTEIGWWCDNATQEANFDVGIYSHDAGNNRPNALIGSSVNNAKGTGAGWKKITGLNIAVTPGTIYWIGIQLDSTATASSIDFTNTAGVNKGDYKETQTALPSSWGSSSGSSERLYAIYALVESSAGAGFFGLF